MANPRPYQHSLTEPVRVGFTGRMGAGKTSAAKYLGSKYGFQYARYSKVLQEWCASDDCDKDRLQKLGWEIMAGGLQAELNSRLIAGLDRSRSAAIDGLRHAADFDSLLSAFGATFRMIFLEASPEARFERLRSRFSNHGAFQAAESHAVEAHIDSLKPFASLTISNDESLDSLYQGLDLWIAASGIGVVK